MINLYDLSRKKIAVLDNAFEIDETKEINSVYSLEFSMPSTDLKNELCQKYYYVRYDEGELYRITSVTKSKVSLERAANHPLLLRACHCNAD